MLHEIGPAKHSQMGGFVGLDWVDIKAWSELMSHEFEPYEADAIFAMSRAYANEFARSNDKHTTNPLDGEQAQMDANFKRELGV